MALKFYTSVAKGLKLKVIKFWRLFPTFVKVKEEKLEGGFFARHPSWIGLKAVAKGNTRMYLRARNLVIGDLHSETKGSRFESGC